MKPAFFVACLLVVISLVIANARNLVAELYVVQTGSILEQADTRNWLDRDAIFSRNVELMSHALALQPNNPAFLEMQGRLKMEQCRYWSLVDRWHDWQQCQREALEFLQAALQGNSRSAFLWANVLLVKFNLGQQDAEFDKALQQAHLLGAHEYDVNRRLAYLALKNWSGWTTERKALFRASLFAMQRVSPRETKAMADSIGKGQLYCTIMQGQPDRHYSCLAKRSKTHPTTKFR